MPNMNRRSFMLSVLSLWGAINRRVFASGIFDSDLDWENHLAHRLVKLIKQRKSAEYIGKNYLHKYPLERNCRYLLDTLVLGNDRIILAESMTEKELKQKIKQNHVSDFTNGQTVSLQGWVLSKTECRLSALAYLHSIS